MAPGTNPNAPSKSASTYHILCGVSLMTLATISFSSFSSWLATVETPSSPKLQAASETTFTTPFTAREPPFSGPSLSLEELTILYHHTASQVHDLQALVQAHSSILAKPGWTYDSYNPRTTEVPKEDVIMGVVPTFCACTKIIGIITFQTALGKGSDARWLQSTSFGFVGVNIGVVGALWGLKEWTWDRIVLFGMVGMDIGMLMGALFSS